MNESPPTLGVPQVKRLNGVPRGRMSAQQQLEALRRVQEQAEQRAQLGARLLTAARETFHEQQSLADSLRDEQKKLRDELHEDVARSFQRYDQYLGDISQGIAQRMDDLTQRLGKIESDWSRAQERIERFVHRAESLMEESRNLLTKTREVRVEAERAANDDQMDVASATADDIAAPPPATDDACDEPDETRAPNASADHDAPCAVSVAEDAAKKPADRITTTVKTNGSPVQRSAPIAEATAAHVDAVEGHTDTADDEAPTREASLIYSEIIDRLRARCREQQRRAATQAR